MEIGEKNHWTKRKTINIHGSNKIIKETVNKMETEKYPKTVRFFNSVNRNGILHPTQKPVALMEYLIKTYTNENETVLDFTFGSGTTAIACLNTNRNFIGIEKDEHYFQLAEKRITDHKSQLRLDCEVI
jgi:site-specific DNA-methyltransferase (adenine-specific)